MSKRLLPLLLIAFSIVRADEGLWLMRQIADLGLEDKGFLISADSIYNPGGNSLSNAIVWLGGCSASLVSPDGLVLTNHHCAYAALQRASAQDNYDYITHGFLAMDPTTEIPAPGQYAYLLTAVEDVSKDVFRAARNARDLTQRDRLMQQKCKEIEEQSENGRDDIRCVVVELFEGREFRKYLFNKYEDLRIVYAPPLSIGKYGGDIDNWMWPRHTGDFTFLRIYTAPDGNPAKFDSLNIPLKTATWLRVAKEDLSDGDPAFIIGFPGRTSRYMTAADIEFTLNKHYIPQIEKYRILIGIMEDIAAKDPAAAIRLANMNASMNNIMKKYQGNVDGMRDTDFIASKRTKEAEIQRFIESDKKRNSRYGDILKGIDALYRERANFETADNVLDAFGYYSGLLYYLADYAYGVAKEREKQVQDRAPEFSEKRVREFVDRLNYQFLSYCDAYDKRALLLALQKAAAASENIAFFEIPENPESWVQNAYKNTRLKDADSMRRLFSMNSAQIEALQDPIVQLAVALYPPKFEKKERMRHWDARMHDYRLRYLEILESFLGKAIYPDATGTMRFTYGNVKGYQPRDAVWYLPFSTLGGMIAKDSGIPPFDMPAELRKIKQKGDLDPWIDPELRDVPSCFLMTGDITNGNSGSAVMNRHGELIGLAFDGNYEAMTSDWMFQEEIQRTIAVDIRYVLFITQKYAKAQWILDEMGL
ncbi:MAG: S46 family peptidase [Candidatus Marinimicrobia bacterium]|jgi:hypothetical protein|nr:S46 family peptidase [Candidatus Neomarinimicrobiota bacterium]MDD4961221.1 S46 family peptidase [Candidatus Neomarinimicrobiota bacterium]MDD5709933.1 S46 family peptidase [Candidatus Neomarinimicrobiota bacterium]MDX9777987.1 S46 family peptidase [bacterium]